MKVTIFSAHKFERAFLESANNNKHEFLWVDSPLNEATSMLARGSSAVVLFVNDDASEKVLDQLADEGIKYIALRSAGFNHVDLDKAKALDLRVANVPDYSPYAVAEHTVALMLALNRKIIKAYNRVHDLNFSLDGLTGFDMHGKTVGVVGTGKIGRILIKILSGFGCRILAFDLNPSKDLVEKYDLRFTSVDELCEQSDIISLHIPLNEHTHYFINQERIAKMKKGVMLINTSRGGLIDTKAVINALKTGHIGYLGLDVYEEEKGLFFEDHSEKILQDDHIARLLTFKNVLITSHQGFLTENALKNIAETTIYNLNCWEKGEPSKYELY